MAAKGLKKMKPDEFIQLWQECKNLTVFLKRSGLKPSQARSRASYYRSRGIELKKYRRPGLNIKHLKKVLADAQAQAQAKS